MSNRTFWSHYFSFTSLLRRYPPKPMPVNVTVKTNYGERQNIFDINHFHISICSPFQLSNEKTVSTGNPSVYKPVMIAINPASLACLTRFHTQVLVNSKHVTNKLSLNINFALILINIIPTICDISHLCCLSVRDAGSLCYVRSELNNVPVKGNRSARPLTPAAQLTLNTLPQGRGVRYWQTYV